MGLRRKSGFACAAGIFPAEGCRLRACGLRAKHPLQAGSLRYNIVKENFYTNPMNKDRKYFNVPTELFLSKDCEWFHDGVRITHQGIIDRLNRGLQRDGDVYYAAIGYERARVIVEDAPYLITGIREESGELILEINDGTIEKYDPATLHIGENNVPYTIVKKTKDRARFTRPAYYQLARYLIETSEGALAFEIGGKIFDINC